MQAANKELSYFRHKIATLLRKGEVEFRRLLEKLPAGAYTCNPQGLITYYNQHAIELWGRAPKLNDPCDRFCGSFKLFSPDGSPIPHDECWMALALKQEEEFNGREIVIERPDGERLTVLSHANPIYDEFGKLIGAVNVLVDITDRKRAEEALKQADKAKNRFLAVLSHELRNPLAPISTALEILRMKTVGSSELDFELEVIDRQVRQMTRLIDDLLDIARITSNKLELRKDQIQLGSVIDAAVEISRPLIEERELQFEISVPHHSLYLQGDMTRLAQVISNLLNNAAKYTDRGGKILLKTERDGSKVHISVIDTGIGIDKDMLPRVFEMFTQANEAMERSPDGLGIGLTLVKEIVEMHGGVVTASSEGRGKGSKFLISLPIIDAPVKASIARETDTKQTDSRQSFRILVVEDNLISADVLSTMLHMQGNDVLTANDGLEALQAAEKYRPEIVLLDIGLPKLNGYDVARSLRQQPWGSEMVLIAITGWGEEQEKLHCAEVGIDYHLVKPVHPTELLTCWLR
jgi:signal transduction histidine kinase